MQNSQLSLTLPAQTHPQPSFLLIFFKSSEPSTVSIDIEIPSWLSNNADATASIHVWELISGGLAESLRHMMDIPVNQFEFLAL